MRRSLSEVVSSLGSALVLAALLGYIAFGAAFRPQLATGQEPAATPTPGSLSPTPQLVATPTPELTATPTSTPSGRMSPRQSPFPGVPAISGGEAIDLIWKGEYEQAERALQADLRTESDPAVRAEYLVYLAFIASIGNDQDAARTLLIEAIKNSPNLTLSPVEFPKILRDALADVRSQFISELPRPQRGSLDNPQHALAPQATPPGWSQGNGKWYRKWYVWAGVGAAVTVAIIALNGGGDDDPTATPTITRTPTVTPTSTGPIVAPTTTSQQFAPCDGINGANRGVTRHEFLYPELAGKSISIRSARVILSAQGDYTNPDEGKGFTVFLENVRISPPGIGIESYCNSIMRSLAPSSLPGTLEQALSDGRVVITVEPLSDVTDNCRNGCSPLNILSLEFTYVFR